MEFSTQLKKIRTENGWTQDELAEKLYVSRQAISKWESDDSVPDLNNLVKLAEILNTPLDNLVLGNTINGSSSGPKIDYSEFTYDPTKEKYVRKFGKMNLWDFLEQHKFMSTFYIIIAISSFLFIFEHFINLFMDIALHN